MNLLKISLLMCGVIFFIGCADEIITSCEESVGGKTENVTASFKSIEQNVFASSCGTASCHGGTAAISGLLLVGDNAYNKLIGVVTINSDPKPLVDPGNSSNSYLMDRLNDNGFNVMPPENRGGKLDQAVIDSIAKWIDNGALNN